VIGHRCTFLLGCVGIDREFAKLAFQSLVLSIPIAANAFIALLRVFGADGIFIDHGVAHLILPDFERL